MKFLLVVAVALVAVVAADDEWKPKNNVEIEQNYEECVKETGVTPAQLNNIRNKEQPDEMLSFILCWVKKMGFFTEDKGFNVDRIISQLTIFYSDAEKMRDIVENCVDSNEQKSTVAEWAFRGEVCLLNSKIGETLSKAKE